MSKPVSILVIDDDPSVQMVLQFTLRHEGYHYLPASTGMAGVSATLDREPSVVLLDLKLPDLNGFEVMQRIRERSQVPIIVLSACREEGDKVAALDGGANDYVTKPFTSAELLVRIRVALRTSSPAAAAPLTGIFRMGALSVDFDQCRVMVDGDAVRLTPTEYRLLCVMIRSAGRVVTNQQILQTVWGPQHAEQVNYLRVYMKRLRHKIEPEPAQPAYLINVHGIGYRLKLSG
jgi:two-component system KDP operon response regulator KdpE